MDSGSNPKNPFTLLSTLHLRSISVTMKTSFSQNRTIAALLFSYKKKKSIVTCLVEPKTTAVKSRKPRYAFVARSYM